MFEAYGWANLGEIEDLTRVEAEIARASASSFAEVRLITQLNWAGAVLTAAACRNHRYEPVIDLFRWLAGNVPDSYGLLFVRDQASEHDNEFRVWRLARGTLAEFPDAFLSPCIPTIEPPYDAETDV